MTSRVAGSEMASRLTSGSCILGSLPDLRQPVTRSSSGYGEDTVEGYIGNKLKEKGILSSDGLFNINDFVPQRDIENYEETVKERLIKAGFVPDDTGFTRRAENLLRSDKQD